MEPQQGPECGQLVQWLFDYGSRFDDILARALAYGSAQYLERGMPLLYCALKKYPQVFEQALGPSAEKAEKEFAKELATDAARFIAELQPLTTNMKVIAANFVSASSLLAELHRTLGSLTLRSSPDLLLKYMDVFCSMAKAAVLLDSVPRRHVTQVVTMASAYVSDSVAAPLRAAVQDNIFTAPTMWAYLQHLLQPVTPRIAQLMDLVVAPALGAVGSSEAVMLAGVLEPATLLQTGADIGMCGMTRKQVFNFMRHREMIKEWALYGCLACPGVLQTTSAASCLQHLLADVATLHVHGDRFTSVHELFQSHVSQALLSQALATAAEPTTPVAQPQPGPRPSHRPSGSLAAGLAGLMSGGGNGGSSGGGFKLWKPFSDKDSGSSSGRSSSPVLDALGAMLATAPGEHHLWRIYLQGQLESIHTAFEAQPEALPAHLDMMLAVLAITREELLWYFRHMDEPVPRTFVQPLTAKGCGSKVLVASSLEDHVQVLELMAAMERLHSLLVSHHNNICTQIRDASSEALRQHVLACTERVEFRIQQLQAPGANAPQPYKDLSELLRSLLQHIPPSDVATRLANARGIWTYLCLQLASLHPPVKAAKVLQYAEDVRYLEVLQQTMDTVQLLHEDGPLLHGAACRRLVVLRHHTARVIIAVRTGLRTRNRTTVNAAVEAMRSLHWLVPSAQPEGSVPAATPSRRNSSSGAAGPQLSGRSFSGGGGNKKPLPGADLPMRCMELLLGYIRHQLLPVVQAPLAAVHAASMGQEEEAPKASAMGQVLKVMTMAKLRVPEAQPASRLRAASENGQNMAAGVTQGGVLGSTAGMGPLAAGWHSNQPGAPGGLQHQGTAGWHEPIVAVQMPHAAELAMQLLPIVSALDAGQVLAASDSNPGAAKIDKPVTGGSKSGGGMHQQANSKVIIACRTQLLDVFRSSFGQLLANTASAISQAAVPVLSIHLKPIMRFLEVVHLLQPHISTALATEMSCQLLQQAGASTLQAASAKAQQQPLFPYPKGEVPSVVGMRMYSQSFTGAAPNLATTSVQPHGLARGSMGGVVAQAGSTEPSSSTEVLTIVQAFRAWLWCVVLQDSNDLGVYYDPQLRAFCSDAAKTKDKMRVAEQLQAATNAQELTLLVEVFGPLAAMELTLGCQTLLTSCLAQLQWHLTSESKVLQQMMDAAHKPLTERVALAAATLPSLVPTGQALTEILRPMGRCLALRMLLGEAAGAAAARCAAFLPFGMGTMAFPTDIDAATAAEQRPWQEVLQLPMGPFGALPARADPLLSAILEGMLPSVEALQCWQLLPALMALVLASPHWSMIASTSAGGSSNSLVTMMAMALGLARASTQVLHPAAGQFLFGVESPATALLKTYQRLAVAVLQATAREHPAAATARKQRELEMLLQSSLMDRAACGSSATDDVVYSDRLRSSSSWAANAKAGNIPAEGTDVYDVVPRRWQYGADQWRQMDAGSMGILGQVG